MARRQRRHQACSASRCRRRQHHPICILGFDRRRALGCKRGLRKARTSRSTSPLRSWHRPHIRSAQVRISYGCGPMTASCGERGRSFTASPFANHAPVVTASDFAATHNQNIAASALFSVTDADDDTHHELSVLGFDQRPGERALGGRRGCAGDKRSHRRDRGAAGDDHVPERLGLR